jgi:CxxC-x17-CxxC domain-containing protein
MFDAVCVECGSDCQVPFKPTEGKPVYCSACFAAKKEAQE